MKSIEAKVYGTVYGKVSISVPDWYDDDQIADELEEAIERGYIDWDMDEPEDAEISEWGCE